MAGKPGVGDPAPGFTLAGTPGGRAYCLGDQRGRPVVLAFYPADNTRVCTLQLRHYSAGLDEFAGLGALVWGISPQDLESHERFSAANELAIPLLADRDKAVGRAYGVVGPIGFYKRSAFVVDAQGVIRYAHRSTQGMTYRRTDELVKAVEAAL